MAAAWSVPGVFVAVLFGFAAGATALAGGPSPGDRIYKDLKVCSSCAFRPDANGIVRLACEEGNGGGCFRAQGACRVELDLAVQDQGSSVDASQVCTDEQACACIIDADCVAVGGACANADDGVKRCLGAACDVGADCESGICDGVGQCRQRCPGTNAVVTATFRITPRDAAPVEIVESFGNCDPNAALTRFYCPTDEDEGNTSALSRCSRSRGRMTEAGLLLMSTDDLRFQAIPIRLFELSQACGAGYGNPVIVEAVSAGADEDHRLDTAASVKHWCLTVYFKDLF